MKTRSGFVIVLAFIILSGGAITADSIGAEPAGGHDSKSLAQGVQNPISNLIQLPFQYNSYYETGPKAKTTEVLLIQPVIPTSWSENWNFIARPIIPLINQPPLTSTQNRNHGLGNVQFQSFFSPKEPVDGWILGYGSALEFPTNSGPDNRFGTDNWSAGPAFVGLRMDGPWVYGGLITQLWSYHGNDAEKNLTTIQPFINYNLEDGWYLTSNPVITANWSAADSRQQLTVPVGGGIGKIFKIGKQPMNLAVRAFKNIESPRNGADWQFQVDLRFLFPK